MCTLENFKGECYQAAGGINKLSMAMNQSCLISVGENAFLCHLKQYRRIIYRQVIQPFTVSQRKEIHTSREKNNTVMQQFCQIGFI